MEQERTTIGNEESKQWLYKNMTKAGYNVGKDYNQFNEVLQDDASRQWLYDEARKMKWNVGDEKTFHKLMGYEIPKLRSDISSSAPSPTSLADNAINAVAAAKEPVAKPVDIPTEVKNPNLPTPIEAERAGLDNLHNQINKSWRTQIFEKPTTDMEAAMTMAGEQKTPEDLLKTFAQAWSEHSDEGKAMLKNMEDVYNDTQNAYLQQFQQTQEYANLVSKLQKEVNAKKLTPEQAGEELSKLFVAQYGNKLEKDKQNLYSDYLKEAQAALEQSPYQKDWNAVNAHIATDQNKDLNSRIDSELEKRTNEIKQQKQSAPQSPLKLARDIMADRKGDVEVAKATKDLQAAKAFATQAEDMITSVRESRNFLADFGKSFGKTITSNDTWDFGVGQLMNSIALKNAADKADKGEPLTHDEELLLEAAANYMAVSMYYSDKVGRGTKAGQTTAASIPFMLEFMLTSGVGAAMTNATTRGITRFAIRMLGNGARKKGVRIGAEVAGKTLSDIGYAELLTNTLSAPRIAEGTISRMNGSVKPQLNDSKDGFRYDGRTGQQELGEALRNAHSDQFIENYSEVVFGALDPLKDPAKAAIKSSKLLGKMAAGVESNAVTGTLIRAWNNPTAVALRKETRFGGLFEETMEEEVGGLFRLVANTDVNNAKDAGLDIDSQIDIVLGLAPSVLLMNGAGATFHYSKQARDVRKMREYLKTDEERQMFDRVMSESRSGEFGREAHDFIREIVMNNDIPNEAKRQIILQTVDKYKDVLSNDLVKQAQQIERQDRAAHRETAIRERIGLQTNESDGKVYRVSIAGNDTEDNFIKKGTIVLNGDGTIDEFQSSGYFVVAITDKDGNTQIKQVPASAITDVAGGESAEDIAQTEIEYYNTLDQAHEIFPEGSIVTIPNSNGAVSEVHYDGQGNILVDVEGGQQVKFTPREAIDKLVPVQAETPQQPQVDGNPTPQPEPVPQEENSEPPQGDIVTFNIAGADVPFEKAGDQYYMLDTDNKRTGRPFSLQDLQEKGAQPIVAETPQQGEQVDITNPKPIGTNKFGNVYQWVTGKAKEAAQFLRQHKNSYLKGVFHRDDIGDIDLVWGNDKAGLQHIVKRHILEQTDFDSISEAIEAISNTIQNGDVRKERDHYVIENNGYRVVITSDNNGNWILTAYDVIREESDKKRIAAEKGFGQQTPQGGSPLYDPNSVHKKDKTTTTPLDQSGTKEENGTLVSPQSHSNGKGTENNLTPQENSEEKVPDVAEDNVQAARKRGFRMENGHRIDRQQPIENKVEGRETNIAFGSETKDQVPARYTLIDASELQPSHRNGVRNRAFFIDEAQPKERTDQVSVVKAQQMAQQIRPGEITRGESAYTGAPIVNSRGEVVQGNNRSAALREMYDGFPDSVEAYKQFLRENAAEFGLTEEDIDKIQNPVLVRMTDTADEEAIRLGNMTAADTESGGVQRIPAKETARKLGDKLGRFIEILTSTEDEEATINSTIKGNAVKALEYLHQNGIINDTQYQSAFNNGSPAADTIADLAAIVTDVLFADSKYGEIRTMYDTLPGAIKLALADVMYRDMQSPDGGHIKKYVQEAIAVYYAAQHSSSEFEKIKTGSSAEDAERAMFAAKNQTNIDGTPAISKRFSNFAIKLATLFAYKKQKELRNLFNHFFDDVQGANGDMFSPAEKKPFEPAVKDNFNVNINDGRQSNDSTPLQGTGGSSSQRGRERTGKPQGGQQDKGGEQRAYDTPSGTPIQGEPENPAGDNRAAGDPVEPQQQNKIFTEDAYEAARRLEQERRERILREGTFFDEDFGLVAPKDITSPQQITDNIEAIVRGLALAEKALGEKGKTNTTDTAHPLSNYSGWVYGNGHIANAQHQIEGYLQALDVLDHAITNKWQKQIGIKTYGDLRNYVEKIYNEAKVARITELEAELNKPLSLEEKKDLIRDISDSKTKVVLVTNKTIVKKLAELGAIRKTIADVAAAVSRGDKVKGFFAKGMVILNTDVLQTGNDIIATYVHERQHLLTAANPQTLSTITDNATADELAQILQTITGTAFYDQYNNGTANGHTALADELVSHIMQEAYATGKDAAEITQNYGINNETILQTLNNIDYEQRQSNSLSKARRDNILGRNFQSSSRQSSRDNQTKSRDGLVQQGTRPAGKGSPRTPSRGQTTKRGEIADTPVSALSFNEQVKSLKELILFQSKEEEQYFDSILPNLKEDKLGINSIPLEVILHENSIIEKLEGRVSDYIAEHYPTQGSVSALTNSPQGKKEREAMRKDPALAQLRKEVNAQQDAAQRKINGKYEEVKAIADNPSITLGEVAQLWNDALEFSRNLAAENDIRFSVGKASDNLHKSLKSSTFAGKKSQVPKAELAVAYADMFRKQAQGQFVDGNGFAYSANYFHSFERGHIVLSIPIEGNEDYITDYQKRHGTNSITGTFSQGAGHLWRSQRPSTGDNGIPQRQRSGNERVDRLHGAVRTDSASDNQKVNRDTQSDSQTELTDPRFSVSGTQVVPLGERTLVGLHNITSDKLRKVLKAGGLANPSAAVIDIAKQDHHGYGEISLVMPSSLVDSREGNNAGTYTGDMWSPTYPLVERRMTNKGADVYYKALNSAFGNDPARRGLMNKIALGFSKWLNNQHDPKDFAYWYMLENGITPQDVLYNSGIPASVKQRFEPIAGKRLYEYSGEDKALLLSLIAEQRGITTEELKQEAQELRQRYQETLDDPNSKVFQRRIAQDSIEDIDTYGVKYNVLEKGIDDLQNAIKYDGKIDIDATLSKAKEQVQANYKDDFEKWLNDFDERFDIKEYIFDGYTRDGDRKYIPNTLANASRLMNREELQNAGSHGGFNATKGQLIERMNTLADIRANKYRLTSKEGKKDAQWEQLSNEWFTDVIDPLSKMQKISDNPFSNVDYAEQRLLDALRQKDPIAHLNKEYGYKITKESTLAKALNDLVQRIKDLPAKYFETKFKRPVSLNEFRNAVIPNDLSQDLRDGLEQAGLGLYEYDPETEGSRREATLQATEDDGIRFSIIGERNTPEAQYDELDYDTDNLTDAQQLATDAVLGALDDAGISVERVSEEEAEREVEKDKSDSNVRLMLQMEQGTLGLSYHPIAGAKIVKNLETAKNNYTNLSNSTKNAISDIAKALGARNTGTSNYITIEAKNGTIFTLRLSNHNATVANFDNNGETNGISIVISRHDDKGITNNGNAHIVEYFYPQMALVKADGTPIADIIGALEQTMYSGEYTDQTGLAQRQEINIPAEPLRTSNGTIYGYAKDGKIYLTDKGFNPNTPIHEYTHLWAKAMQAKNLQGWQSVVGLLKGTPMWDEVANDPHYSHLTDDNAVASEVLSRYSGSRGAQLFEQKSKSVLEQNPSISAFARVRVLLNNVREALNKFWNWVGKDLFHIDHFDSIEEVADRILYDLTNGTDLGTDIKNGVAEMQIAPLPKKEGESIADYAKRMVDYQNSFAVDQAAQKAQFEYEKHINEQHSALRKLEKGVTDFAKPIMSFQEYMVKQGAIMDIDSDTYQDIWRAGSRTQTSINKYHRECEEPLANTVKSIVNSQKLNNLGFVWQNLPYDSLKKDKEQMNNTAITPRRIVGLYLQAKDCEEALQLGLVDRGAAGFEQNVCLPNVEGYEHGVPYTKIIEMVEDALGKDMVDILWKRVRAAVDYGLDYQVKRGMISEETRNKYKREFYVPQRGWEERDMSGLATDYQRAGGALYGSPYNSALKQAKGRTSLAADPFAYITSIAYSSITSADDNVTRQHLLKFCLDNEELGLQSGAFRIKKFWVVREIDADGNIIGEPTISYAQPTERMYEHDKEINAKLGTIRKQLGELNRLESQWQSVVEIENINDVVREAVNKKLQSIRDEKANLETEAEALNSQFCVLNSRSTDGFNLQLSEDEIGDLTKLDQDTHRTKAELNQHVIYVEHNGQKYALLFKNEQIPNALNKTYKSSLMEIPLISEAARKATRLISATLTQYNPEFAARNYIKDRQTAITTLSVEQGAKFTAKFEANLNSPLLNAAVMQYAFNDNVRDRGKVSGKYKDLLNEYFEHGAQTGYSFLPDLQRVRKDFDKLLKNNNAKEFGKATINMLSVLTEASETSIRFAAYVTARESGMSADAAASLSKELTTNFNRHGEWSNSALMSLYSFMRATINGNLKYLRGFKKFPVGFSIAAAAYYAAGVLCSLLNPNDPDNDIWFTDYVRETNITLGKFLGITAKIPLGHFMVMFYAAGVNTVAGVRGNKSAGEAVFDTMQMASNELLPSWMNFMAGATYDTNTGMGFDATQFAQSAAPSVVSPFVDVWLNRNFMGGRISNEYDWNKDEKDILKYKSGTSQFYIDIANGLYEAVGGDLKVKNKLDDNTIQKLVDVSPSATEHIVEGYSPAIAETILQTAAVIQSAAKGADIAADELPFVRKFYSSYHPERAAAQQYYMLKSRSKDYSDLLKEYQKKDRNKYNSEKAKGKVDLNERTQRTLKRIKLDSPSNADIKTLMELNREWNKID